MLSHFQDNNSIKRIILSLIMLFIFSYSLGLSLRNLLRFNKFKQELVLSENELLEQIEIKRKFKKEIERMKQDDYWELEAKKKLGYSQSDEYIYKFYSVEGY